MGTALASTLNEIHAISTKAVLGGLVFLVCCILLGALFTKNDQAKHYIFLSIIGIVALVSGVLAATALFITNNPSVLFREL
jgi:hypothetical protein